MPGKIKQHNSWRTDGFWVAHASRVLVSASRRNDLPRKVRESGTLSPTRETRALPNRGLLCSQRFHWIEQTRPPRGKQTRQQRGDSKDRDCRDQQERIVRGCLIELRCDQSAERECGANSNDQSKNHRLHSLTHDQPQEYPSFARRAPCALRFRRCVAPPCKRPRRKCRPWRAAAPPPAKTPSSTIINFAWPSACAMISLTGCGRMSARPGSIVRKRGLH